MKVALVYDRVNKWGGAERVLLALHEMFPDAPLYAAVYSPKNAQWAKVFPEIHTSFLQKIPFLNTRHELLGTFMPIAFETFDFSGFDLVISVTSEAAKGIITKPPTKHICICLTPTRYLWSGYDYYFRNPVLRFFSRPAVRYLRKWDKMAAQRPDKIVAISGAVKERIDKYYGRESEIIYPPVDANKFQIASSKSQTNHNLQNHEYYLLVSRLVPYKRVDLAIEVFNELKTPLVVVGRGSQAWELKLKAKKNIKFVGAVGEEELAGYYKNAKALVMPQEEDFGIVAVETQAAGAPVIAYAKGGASDTVVSGKTGVLFKTQNKESLKNAIKKFEKMNFDKEEIRKNAQRFSNENFRKELKKVINGIVK